MQIKLRSILVPRHRAVGVRGWLLQVTLLSLPLICVAEPLSEWREPKSGLEFVQIPPGCFEQGEPMAGPTDDGMPIPMPREDEVPVRRVCLDGFWLGKWEVTNSQWQRIMGVDNGEGDLYPQRPKANVSWDNVQRFVGRLNQQVVEEGVRYRLPSEVEWEYACHAGSKRPAVQLHAPDRQRWTEELAKQALFREPSQSDPHTIDAGSKVANGWGLYDMLGNVWEWTADPYRADAYRHPYLPEGETSGAEETRVIRGGSYKSDLAQVRCGVRNYFYVSDRTRVIGFRLVMERDEK